MQFVITASENLIETLAAINSHPARWNSPVARQLFKDAHAKLAGTARKFNADPSEAVTYAWEAWSTSDLTKVHNPWGWTNAAVVAHLAAAQRARETLSSIESMQREGFEAFTGFADDCEAELSVFDTTTTARPPAADTFKTEAFTYAHGLLVGAGYSLDVSTAIVDRMAHVGRTATATREKEVTTLVMARDRAVREQDLPLALGIPTARWAALASLLFGNKRGTDMGLIEAFRTGVDPQTIRNIRASLKRFYSAVGVAELEPAL